MKQKTFQELEKELFDSKKREKKLKERAGTLKGELLQEKRYAKSLIGQYERVIKDWKRVATEYRIHIFKMFFVTIYEKITKRGGVK